MGHTTSQLLGSMMLMASTVSCCIAAFRFAGVACKDDRRCMFFLVGWMSWGILSYLILLLLGTVGLLNRGTILAVSLVLLAISVSASSPWATTLLRGKVWSGSSIRLYDVPAVVVLSASLGLYVYFTFLSTPVWGYDDFSYHATATVHWWRDGRLSLAPQNYHCYYPLNAELLASWFFIPLGGDAWFTFTGLYWIVLLMLAVLCLGMAFGVDWQTGCLFAGLIGLLPTVIQVERTYAAVDLAGPAMVLCAIAILDRWSRNGDCSKVLLLAGAACGFAVGCKVSFLPCAVVLAGYVLLKARGAFSGRIVCLATFCSVMVVTGGYFYLSNLLITGNPFYPAAVGPFTGPFTSSDQFRTSLLGVLARSGFAPGTMLTILRQNANWPLCVALLSCVGYASALWTVFGHHEKDKETRDTVVLLSVVGITAWILFPLMPFSGTANSANAPLMNCQRYAILPLTAGIILCFTNWRRKGVLISAALFVVSWLGICDRRFAVVLCLGGVVGLGVYLLSQIRSRYSPGCRAAVCAGVIIAGTIVLVTPHRQRLVDQSVIDSKRMFCFDTVAAWIWVDGLPHGARVCQFGSTAWQYYHLFGRGFALDPLVLNDDGTTGFPLHEYSERSWWGANEFVSANVFLQNLRHLGVDYVVVTREKDSMWPAQRDALDGAGGVSLVYSDASVRGYRL